MKKITKPERIRMADGSKGFLEIDFPIIRVTGVWSLLRSSFKIFFGNFLVILKVVLVVSLPLKFVKNWVLSFAGVQDPMAIFIPLEPGIRLVFGSLVIPALVFALFQRFRGGKNPQIVDCFRWGLRQWPRVFLNEGLAGLFILGGLVFLVVPGIYFSICFVFVGIIVSIEADNRKHVLRRSRELVRDNWWLLFISFFVVFVLLFLVGLIPIVAERTISFHGNWFYFFLADCLSDVVGGFSLVVFLLAYLHLVSLEKEKEAEPTSPKTV